MSAVCSIHAFISLDATKVLRISFPFAVFILGRLDNVLVVVQESQPIVLAVPEHDVRGTRVLGDQGGAGRADVVDGRGAGSDEPNDVFLILMKKESEFENRRARSIQAGKIETGREGCYVAFGDQ